MSSPTARSLARLRADGYTAAVVERWLPHAGVRKDFLGCIDILAVKPGEPVLGIQATSADHVAHRLAKARALPELAVWLRAGCAFQVWGWAKKGQRWAVRVVEVRAQDLEAIELVALPKKRRARKWERQTGLFDFATEGTAE